MRNFRKYVFMAVLFCCVSLGVNAQTITIDSINRPITTDSKKINVSIKINKNTWVRFNIMQNGVHLSNNDSITKGDTIHLAIKWDTSVVDKVFFKNSFIPKPNQKEIQTGEYSFTIAPEKTTTFKYVAIMKSEKELPQEKKTMLHGYSRKIRKQELLL